MLQYKTIEPATLELLKSLQSLPELQQTRLVGGTALALQLGHRKSIDLDFFGTIDMPSFELRDLLSEAHKLTVVHESKNINIYDIDQVKVVFVNYKYSWIDDVIIEDRVRLAGIKDIAAMKSLAYFNDAESNPMPFMFDSTQWMDMKASIRKALQAL